MAGIMVTIGRIAGALGVLLTLGSGAARIAGLFWVGSFSTGTLLLGGMAAMLIGCLALLTALTAQRGADDRAGP